MVFVVWTIYSSLPSSPRALSSRSSSDTSSISESVLCGSSPNGPLVHTDRQIIGAQCRCTFRYIKCQVQGGQHGNAVACANLASIADFAHGGVHALDRFEQSGIAAFRATQKVGLPHDLNFELFHDSSFCTEDACGSLSSSKSTRARAALRRDLRLNRAHGSVHPLGL
jgi:hypothetical protein